MESKPLLVGLAVLVIAGGIFLAVRSSGDKNIQDSTTDTASSTDTTVQSESKFNASFADLLTRQGDWKCTFSFDASGMQSTGTTYISNGNMRGDFTSAVAQANMNVESHMVQAGGYMYIWTSLAPTGYKVKMASSMPAGNVPNQPLDMSKQYEYDCTPWTVDSAVFVPPSTITFNETN